MKTLGSSVVIEQLSCGMYILPFPWIFPLKPIFPSCVGSRDIRLSTCHIYCGSFFPFRSSKVANTDLVARFRKCSEKKTGFKTRIGSNLVQTITLQGSAAATVLWTLATVPYLTDSQGQCDIDNDCPAGYKCTYQCSQGVHRHQRHTRPVHPIYQVRDERFIC